MNIKSLLAILFLFTFYNHAWADDCTAPSLELTYDKWTLIALPCRKNPNLGTYTVGQIFGEALDIEEYDKKWVVYRFDGTSSGYKMMQIGGFLFPGVGYWIIQLADESGVEIQMPLNAIATFTETETNTFNCITGDSTRKCINVPLKTIADSVEWNMLGNPYHLDLPVGDLVIKARVGGLVPPGTPGKLGSSLTEAQEESVFNAKIWQYNPDGEGGYEGLTSDGSDTLSPWRGFWGATLKNANSSTEGVKIRFPIKPPTQPAG